MPTYDYLNVLYNSTWTTRPQNSAWREQNRGYDFNPPEEQEMRKTLNANLVADPIFDQMTNPLFRLNPEAVTPED